MTNRTFPLHENYIEGLRTTRSNLIEIIPNETLIKTDVVCNATDMVDKEVSASWASNYLNSIGQSLRKPEKLKRNSVKTQGLNENACNYTKVSSQEKPNILVKESKTGSSKGLDKNILLPNTNNVLHRTLTSVQVTTKNDLHDGKSKLMSELQKDSKYMNLTADCQNSFSNKKDASVKLGEKNDDLKTKSKRVKNFTSRKVLLNSKRKSKHCKKVKLTINVVTENKIDGTGIKSDQTKHDNGLSFLDDLDIDEIVNCLKSCDNENKNKGLESTIENNQANIKFNNCTTSLKTENNIELKANDEKDINVTHKIKLEPKSSNLNFYSKICEVKHENIPHTNDSEQCLDATLQNGIHDTRTHAATLQSTNTVHCKNDNNKYNEKGTKSNKGIRQLIVKEETHNKNQKIQTGSSKKILDFNTTQRKKETNATNLKNDNSQLITLTENENLMTKNQLNAASVICSKPVTKSVIKNATQVKPSAAKNNGNNVLLNCHKCSLETDFIKMFVDSDLTVIDCLHDTSSNNDEIVSIETGRKSPLILNTKKTAKVNENFNCTQNKAKTTYENLNLYNTKIKGSGSLENKSKTDSPEDIFFSQDLVQKIQIRLFDRFKENYDLTAIINKARYSSILKCQNKNGKTFALKIINSTKIVSSKEKKWLQLQDDIPEESLKTIRLLHHFPLEKNWCFFMVYYPKNLVQALEELGKPFHISSIRKLARQLVTAVTVLRQKNIVHTDINPYHVLLNTTNDQLKLCGFNKLSYVEEIPDTPNVGSANYRAPEVILGVTAGYGIDVWSTALVIYEMATNVQLFPGKYNNDILFKQMSTLGNIPSSMLSSARFLTYHFKNNLFIRRLGPNGQKIMLIEQFIKSKRMYTTIFNNYQYFWAQTRSKIEKLQDLEKLEMLYDLLEQMLSLNPKYRLPIEFVFANPFIYEMYD